MKALSKAVMAAFVLTMLPGCGPESEPIQPAAGPTNTVAVIVIDDFTIAEETDEFGAPGGAGDDCAYAGAPSNNVDSYGGGDGLPPNVSHGQAVSAVLRSHLGKRQLGKATQANVWPYSFKEAHFDGKPLWWSKDGRDLVYLEMHVRRYKTTDLITQIDEVLKSNAFSHVVLNMSFVVAPCDLGPWFAEHPMAETELVKLYNSLIEDDIDLDRFRVLLKEAATQTGDTWSTETATVLKLALNRVAADPFANLTKRYDKDDWNTFVTTYVESGKATPVAAAGNGMAEYDGKKVVYKKTLGFPFAPAGWKGVLSVSAADETGKKAEYSNAGEIMMDGRATINGSAVQGTSFAAPWLSAEVAFFLLTGGPNPACLANAKPILDYRSTADFPAQRFDDKSRSAAAQSKCPEMNAALP